MRTPAPERPSICEELKSVLQEWVRQIQGLEYAQEVLQAVDFAVKKNPDRHDSLWCPH